MKRRGRPGLREALLLAIAVGTLSWGAGPLMANPRTNDRADDWALEALADQVTITPAQAVRAAKAKEKGRVKEICLKAVSGKPVYEVEFEGDREVLVDARTGKVIAKPKR